VSCWCHPQWNAPSVLAPTARLPGVPAGLYGAHAPLP